ncbi:hypothetical protein CVT26_003574 [Gymnopilus dilepis]|uniref:Ricin B lectin domain-containing protein n=1 Tax=Gymnopilus dilepis TaxID=231916 RepID=A0A409VSG2_9AGAR|nr:hypothetical protein CVT26_003574 [Gymnopilus dilepis]
MGILTDLNHPYVIVNKKTKTVLDLSGQDQKSIIGWSYHAGANQQWRLIGGNDGLFLIKSVSSGKYLRPLNGETKESQPLVAGNEPYGWDIKIDAQAQPGIRICAHNSDLVADLWGASANLGTEIKLFKAWYPGENQVWVLQPVVENSEQFIL